MDLLNFGANVIGGILVGSGDIASIVIGSALQAIGLANNVAQPIANAVAQTTTVAVSTAAVAGTAYGATRLGIWALFVLSTKKYILEHVESVGYRIAQKGKSIALKNVSNKNNLIEMRNFVDEAMVAFKSGVDKGLL